MVGVAAYVSAHFGVQVLHKPPTGAFAVRLNLLGPICILISADGRVQSCVVSHPVLLWLALTLMGWWRSKQAGRPVAGTRWRAPPGASSAADRFAAHSQNRVDVRGFPCMAARKKLCECDPWISR
ncbi:CBU_0592 family membrane protein [Cupriavidus basilensis]